MIANIRRTIKSESHTNVEVELPDGKVETITLQGAEAKFTPAGKLMAAALATVEKKLKVILALHPTAPAAPEVVEYDQREQIEVKPP